MKIGQLDLFCAIVRHLNDAGVPAMPVDTYNEVLEATNSIVKAIGEMPEPEVIVVTDDHPPMRVKDPEITYGW